MVVGGQKVSGIAGALVLAKVKSSFQVRTSGCRCPESTPARSSQTSNVQFPNADSPRNGFKVSSGRKYASRPPASAVTCTMSSSAPLVVKERNSNDVFGSAVWKVSVLVRHAGAVTVMLVAKTPLVRIESTGRLVGYPGGGVLTNGVGSVAVRKVTRYWPFAAVLKLVAMPPGTQLVIVPLESHPPFSARNFLPGT